MRTTRELAYQILEYLKALIIPICLLILVVLLLTRITNLGDTQTYNTVLGIALGVFLGFLADLTKRTLDSLQAKLLLRKVSLKLLEADARKIYHTLWMLGRALQDKTVVDPKAAFRPPRIELRYWSRLNEINSFLLLGAEPPFERIFDQLMELEKINELIYEADQGNRQALMFVTAITKQAIKDKHHRTLLLNFMSDKEIGEMENEWLNLSKSEENNTKVR